MSIIQAELYEALIEADASKEKAHAAAAAVATITTNYPKPEALATKDYIGRKVADLEGRIYRAMWIQGVGIVGINIAMLSGVTVFLASLIK